MNNKTWYLFIESKGVFVRISEIDLDDNDIVCCKVDGNLYKEGTSSTFVVTSALDDEHPLEVKPLFETLGKINTIRKEHGIFIRPSKIKKYIKENGDIDDDEVDEHWYEIGFNELAKQWYDLVNRNMPQILERRISE